MTVFWYTVMANTQLMRNFVDLASISENPFLAILEIADTTRNVTLETFETTDDPDGSALLDLMRRMNYQGSDLKTTIINIVYNQQIHHRTMPNQFLMLIVGMNTEPNTFMLAVDLVHVFGNDFDFDDFNHINYGEY
jgi:hypothetical protein